MMKKPDVNEVYNKLLKQYQEKFNDTLPFRFMGLSKKEEIKLMYDCLSKNQPYKPQLPKGAVM